MGGTWGWVGLCEIEDEIDNFVEIGGAGEGRGVRGGITHGAQQIIHLPRHAPRARRHVFPGHPRHVDRRALLAVAFDLDEAFVVEIEVVDGGEGFGGVGFVVGEVGFCVRGCYYGEVCGGRGGGLVVVFFFFGGGGGGKGGGRGGRGVVGGLTAAGGCFGLCDISGISIATWGCDFGSMKYFFGMEGGLEEEGRLGEEEGFGACCLVEIDLKCTYVLVEMVAV